MEKLKKILLSPFLLLSSCSSQQIADYKNEKPILKLEEYLSGDLIAHGIFQDRKGQVKKRFIVKIKGNWQGAVGTLDESFQYSDGSTSKRVWTIRKISDSEYRGTASDVIGEAVGIVSGNALQWKYILSLDVDGKNYHVHFDDWMYLMDDKVMLNKSKMSKFGIDLGEVTLSFYKN